MSEADLQPCQRCQRTVRSIYILLFISRRLIFKRELYKKRPCVDVVDMVLLLGRGMTPRENVGGGGQGGGGEQGRG